MIQALLPVARWTKRRKAEVVWALTRRLITPMQACAAHGLSEEELASWMRRHRVLGADGLMATRRLDRRCRPALEVSP